MTWKQDRADVLEGIMRTLVVTENITLDGVIDAEGGWSSPPRFAGPPDFAPFGRWDESSATGSPTAWWTSSA